LKCAYCLHSHVNAFESMYVQSALSTKTAFPKP